MKHLLLIAALILGSFAGARAQDGLDDNEKKQKLEALYVAYITKELQLTAEDAQKFWPVHGEFDREVRAVKHDQPELDRQQRVLDIKKRYQERFSRILGGTRTETFFRKDGEFRRKLIERLRKMRQNRQNNNFRQRKGA